jgi:hypothetical protein
MYKIFLFILLIINIAALFSLAISWLYYSIVTDIFESTVKEDSRKYLKLKNVFSLPLFYLQIALLVIEIVYFIIFFILHNVRLSQALGLGTNKISKQISHDYSNFFLEILFNMLIKGSGLLISLFFILKSSNELDFLKMIEEDRHKKDLISDANHYLNFLFIIVCSSLILFVIFYLTKYIHIKKKNLKTIALNTSTTNFIALN